MEYKLIDERNLEFITNKTELYNQDEILGHIRLYLYSGLDIINYIIIILFLSFVVFVWVQSLINSIYMVGDSGLTIKLIEGILISIIVIILVMFPILVIIKELPFIIKWRKGIGDKQMLEFLIEYGEIAEGQVISVSKEQISYEFAYKNKTLQNFFKTLAISQFKEGDKLAVLYVKGREKIAVVL